MSQCNPDLSPTFGAVVGRSATMSYSVTRQNQLTTKTLSGEVVSELNLILDYTLMLTSNRYMF